MPAPAQRIEFDCPHCRQTIAGTSDMCGQVIACPSCQAQLQIPAALPNPPPRKRGKTAQNRQPEQGQALRPLTPLEWVLMMWPLITAIVWGKFFGGPRLTVGYEEASGMLNYAGKTVGPVLGLSLFAGASATILYTRQPILLKIVLTTVVGLAALLVWPYIGHKPAS